MKKKETIGYAILAVLLFAAFTSIWNYRTSLPWLSGRLSPVITPVLLGICIGFVLNMPAKAIENRLHVRHSRGISIAASIILLLIAAALLITLVVPELVDAVSLLIASLRDFAGRQDFWNADAASIPIIGPYLADADSQILTLADSIESYISEWTPSIISFTLSTLGSFISFWATFFIACVFAVYFIANKEMLSRHLGKLLSLFLKDSTLAYLRHAAEVSATAFSRFISAQVTEAIIIGVLCLIGMLIFRFPYAPVISALTGAMALIPIYGAVIGALVGAFMIAVADPWQGLFFLIFIFVLQQLEGDLIYPRVVGTTTGVPAVYVFASVTIGGAIAGLAGMLFAVPVFSIAFTLLKELYERRSMQRKEDAEAGS